MAAVHQQIVLVATRTASAISAWDVQTGTHLSSFKDSASSPNSLSLLGRDYIVAAQHPKGSLHFWTWHKDQVLQRSYAAEPMLALACTLDGAFCAGGGPSGSVHLWEVGSGRLLRTWAAHYKAVTALAFTDDGAMLLSGGEDTVVSAWLLMDLLDAAAMQQGGTPTFHAWSEHTLPVTALRVGMGTNPIVVSASLDRSLKIWSLAQGVLLRSAAFPVPLHCLAIGPAEHALYAGGGDGRIFELPLAGNASDRAGSARSTSGSGSGGGGMANGHGVAAAPDQERVALEGHARCVTCLQMTTDGRHLLSGSEDGTVRVWEVRSRQPIRVIAAPDRAPVTGLLALDRPPFLAAGQGRRQQGAAEGAHSDGASAKGPKRPQPLAPLCKFPGMTGAVQPWEGPPVVLDGSQGYRGGVASTGLLDPVMADDPAQSCLAAGPGPSSAGGASSSAAAAVQPSTMQDREAPATDGQGMSGEAGDLAAQNEDLRRQLNQALGAAARWQGLHSQLHAFCVDRVLPAAAPT